MGNSFKEKNKDFFEDCVELITCNFKDKKTIVEKLKAKYGISQEAIYYRIRSYYGKTMKQVRAEMLTPSKEELLRAVLKSKTTQECRSYFPNLPISDWTGIYQKVLGVGNFSQAREMALSRAKVEYKTFNPSVKDNEALLAATILGDGSFDNERASLKIEHCAKQKGWLEAKVEIYNKAFPFTASKITHNEKRDTYSWYSLTFRNSPKYVNLLFKLKADKSLCADYLTPFGVWVLFIDDGCYQHKTQQLVTLAVENEAIATNLQKFFKTYGFDFKYNGKHELRITHRENVIKFFKTFIEPYQGLLPKCMEYKGIYKI